MEDQMKVNDDFFSQLSGEGGPPVQEQEGEKVEVQTPAPDAVEKEEVKVTEDTPKPEFNIKDHFPDYESIDDVKAVLSRAKEFPKDEEISSWKQKAEEYGKSSEFIETLRKSGLNNDYLRLNALESQKSEKADVYKKLLFGEVTDTELIKLDLIDKYPELKEDREMLDFQLEEKYPHIFGEDADPESDEFEKSKKKMKFEASQVSKRLKSEFNEVGLPETLDPEYGKKQMQATLETWKPNFEKVSDELLTIDVNVEGEKFMDIKIPESETKEYKDAALMFLAQNNLNYGKESLQQVRNYVKAMYVSKNLDSYNKAILSKRDEMTNEQWRKFVHNPAPVDKSKAAKTNKTDDFKTFLDQLDN